MIVAVSEGIHDADGSYITSSKAACDQFGHQQLSGAGKALEFIVKENICVKVRSVEVNVFQRCASHLASLTDIGESFAQGKKGVTIAAEGVTASMVYLKPLIQGETAVAYKNGLPDYMDVSHLHKCN